VYKVNDRRELLEAYDGTAPYCMTLQEFIDFDSYVAASRSARRISRRSTTIRASGGISSSMPTCRPSSAPRRPRRADDQSGARLRDEHDRVRGARRRPVRDRLSESGADFERDRITDFYFLHVSRR
jgi:hypothetical protein